MHVKCDGCQRTLSVPDNSAGLLVQCGRCGKKVRIPPATAGAAAGAAPGTPAPQSDESATSALYQAMMDQAALEGQAAPAPESPSPPTDVESELEPEPQAAKPGKIAARKEIRVSDAGVKSGYAVADEPPPPVIEGLQSSPRNLSPPNPMLKIIAGALALLLVIGVIAAIVSKLGGSRRPDGGAPITNTSGLGGGSTTPVTPPPPAPSAHTLPEGLKEAVLALGANTPLWLEVVDSDSGEPAKPLIILTSSGDFAMDVTNVHIRGKEGGARLSQMRANIASAISESVAGKLRARGLTVMDAARPTPGMDASKANSRLRIVIRTTPVCAGFDFTECRTPPRSPVGTGPAAFPTLSVSPATFTFPSAAVPAPKVLLAVSRFPGRGSSGRYPGRSPGTDPDTGMPARPVVPPSIKVPIDFWDALLERHQLSALCMSDAREASAPNWIAVASDDPRVDPVPCGLRISIVHVLWETGERTFDLTARSVSPDAASAGSDSAEPGIPIPTRRPEALREFQITATLSGAHACVLSGFFRYDDVDLLCGAGAAGDLVASLLPAPEAEWRTIWSAGTTDRAALASAWRSVLQLGGGQAIADLLAAQPNCFPPVSAEVLVSVLKEDRNSQESVHPFLGLRGVCADAALCGVASHAKGKYQKDYVQWCAAPGEHSKESVQAACCALIDLGQPGPEVNGLIEGRVVPGFPFVRMPQGSLAFAPSVAETILAWLIRDGTPAQKLGAVTAAADNSIERLRPLVAEYAQRAAGMDADALAALCRSLDASRSPMAFEVLATVAHGKLKASDIGDRLAPPSAASGAPAPEIPGRFSHSVAALVCANLARCDKFKAGEVLVDLLGSRGPITRITAVETLMALDYVDAAKDVRTRWSALKRIAKPSGYEALECEAFTEAQAKLYRYDDALTRARNLAKNGNAQEAIEKCRQIIAENPSPNVVKDANQVIAEAEKQLADPGGSR